MYLHQTAPYREKGVGGSFFACQISRARLHCGQPLKIYRLKPGVQAHVFQNPLWFRESDLYLLSGVPDPLYQEVAALFRIGWIFPAGLLDLCDNEGELTEWSGSQPPQECRYRITLVPCQFKTVAEFMHRDPPFISGVLFHVCFEQLRDVGVFSHSSRSMVFLLQVFFLFQDSTLDIRFSMTAGRRSSIPRIFGMVRPCMMRWQTPGLSFLLPKRITCFYRSFP